MKKWKSQPGESKWESAANALARTFTKIVPCGKCGGPVVYGYCCGHCDCVCGVRPCECEEAT